jgi:hypothetical protein
MQLGNCMLLPHRPPLCSTAQCAVRPLQRARCMPAAETLKDPKSWCSLEIITALEHNIPLCPVRAATCSVQPAMHVQADGTGWDGMYCVPHATPGYESAPAANRHFQTPNPALPVTDLRPRKDPKSR